MYHNPGTENCAWVKAIPQVRKYPAEEYAEEGKRFRSCKIPCGGICGRGKAISQLQNTLWGNMRKRGSNLTAAKYPAGEYAEEGKRFRSYTNTAGGAEQSCSDNRGDNIYMENNKEGCRTYRWNDLAAAIFSNRIYI